MKTTCFVAIISLFINCLSSDAIAGLSMSVKECDAIYGNPESTENWDIFHERFYRIRGKNIIGLYEICVRVLFYRGKAVATNYVNMKGNFNDLPFNVDIINSKGVKKNPFNESIMGDRRPHRRYYAKYTKTGFMRYACSIVFVEDNEFLEERIGDWGI